MLFSPSLHFYVSGISISNIRFLLFTEFPLNCLICELKMLCTLKSNSLLYLIFLSRLKEGGVEGGFRLMKTDLEHSSSSLKPILSACRKYRGEFIFILLNFLILHPSYYYRNSQMEINQGDKGIFKGLGALQKVDFTNRRFFPSIRNRHQFDYSHHHPNQYRTIFSTFSRPYNPQQYSYKKVKKNPNESQICFGNQKGKTAETWNKSVFTEHDLNSAAKLIRPREEGLGINQHEKRTGERVKYSTTTQDTLTLKKKSIKYNSLYKYDRGEKYNPITGEKKMNMGCGYQDYAPNREIKYKANNRVKAIASGEYDIINGRKLTCG